jgi:ribonuclease HII
VVIKNKPFVVSRRRDLNPRPADYESAAPPAKLRRQVKAGILFHNKKVPVLYRNIFLGKISYKNYMICGADESGRGPIMGPLVVAGVLVKNDSDLIHLDVRDSKKITPKRREILSKTIKNIVVNYEILSIPASDIDDLRKTMTLNEIEVYAFSKVISTLRPEICYVDAADVNEKRFGKDIISNLTFYPKIISKHKADDIYPVVSAASILAKTARDEMVSSIEKQLQKKLSLPLGSGYPADPITIAFLKEWIKKYGSLPPHCRHSWKTSQRLLREKSLKKLDDF